MLRGRTSQADRKPSCTKSIRRISRLAPHELRRINYIALVVYRLQLLPYICTGTTPSRKACLSNKCIPRVHIGQLQAHAKLCFLLARPHRPRLREAE
eukprot:6173858-Pleurochrysis_carterae.AAC.3